jgi:voltage-gated sodium channel
MSSPPSPSALRQRVRGLIETRRFDHAITAVIVANAIGLGLETSPEVMARFGGIIQALDRAAVAIFVVELAISCSLTA